MIEAAADRGAARVTALADLGIALGRVLFVMLFVLNLGGLLTWVERKQSAIMQDRIGANRASIFGFRILGLFHPLADAIKMLTKEDFLPARADRFLFKLAPFVSVFFALVAFASIPFGDTLRVAEREIPLQAITLNVGRPLRLRHALARGVRRDDGGLVVGQQLRAHGRAARGRPHDLRGDRHRRLHHGRGHGLRVAEHDGHRAGPGRTTCGGGFPCGGS